MKKIITIIALSICVSAYAEKIKIRESKENIGGGNNNALVVTLYGVDPSDAEDSFKDFMKKYDGKRSGKDGGIFIDNADIKEMSGNSTIDIYAKALGKKGDNEITFIVAFDLGGAFLNSSQHSSQFKTAEKITKEFAIKTVKAAIEAELKAAQKTQRNLEGDQQDLEKDNKELHDDIEKYKARIKEAEDNLVTNNASQDKKKTEIEAQKKVVSAVEAKLKGIE
jgi:hypothetical protein